MRRMLATSGRQAWWGGVVLCWLLAAAGAFAAEEAPLGGGGREISLKDAPVAEAIEMIATAEGMGLIMTDAVTGTIKYLNLKDKRPEEVLDQICKAFDLRWYKDESGTLIVKGKHEGGAGQQETPAAVEPLPAAPPPRGDHKALIELRFADSQDLSYRFGGADQPLTQRYRDWSNRNLASRMGGGGTMGRAVTDWGGSVGGSAAGLPGGEAGGPFKELAGYMPQYQLPGTYVPGVGRGRAPAPGVPGQRVAQPGQAGYQPGVAGAAGALSWLLPEGLEGPPIAFQPLNALIVRGTEEAIEEFRKLVALLDVKVKQVEVEAQLIALSVEDSRALGIDWTWLTSEVTVDVGISPGGGTFVIQHGRGDFAATLSTLLQTSRARLISAPRVTAANNFPTSISFGTEQVIFLSSSVVQPGLPGGQVITGTDIINYFVTSTLFVVPRINGDNSVTLDIMLSIQNEAGVVVGPDGQQVPKRALQNVGPTQVTIQDGETLVMGGFVTKNWSKSKNKIPLLSELPIIGSLFTGTSEQLTESETLIFVTPRIIPQEQAGAATWGVAAP